MRFNKRLPYDQKDTLLRKPGLPKHEKQPVGYQTSGSRAECYPIRVIQAGGCYNDSH